MKFKVIEKSRFLNSDEKESLKGGSVTYCPNNYADCSDIAYGMCKVVSASYTSTCLSLNHTCGTGALFEIACYKIHDTCSHLENYCF